MHADSESYHNIRCVRIQHIAEDENHHPFGDARHSAQPLPLGFEAGLIPRRPFFVFDFILALLSTSCFPPHKTSSHQENLPGSSFLRRCLSLGCFTERQFLANGDYQPSISHGFGHELKSPPVEF